MPRDWLILHGGALGDLVLTLQFALRLPGVRGGGRLDVVSRVDPGDLSSCRPPIRRWFSEGWGLHWLFGDHDDAPPARLAELVRGRHVLSALAGAHTVAHHRLLDLRPARLISIDPRPRAGVERHITQQWQSQLEGQGLLVPKCVHQRPRESGVGVAVALRDRSAVILERAGIARSPILIHPGSGGRRKCWPLMHFVELGAAWRAAGRPVAFVSGPVEDELLTDAERGALESCGAPTLRPSPDDLVALLATAGSYVGNDAGPTHLAALLGTLTVVLFGPTSARLWRPLGPRVRVLEGDPQRGGDWGLAVADVLGAGSA